MDPIDVSEVLSQALAAKLAMQMSVSSLPVIEEWMDTPLTRWLDSVPLPMEMPDGDSPPMVVSIGSDARLVRWSAAGAPEGMIPKLVEYLKRAGAVPDDFQRVDEAGQALEPREVGSWIEVRPGSIATGWLFQDRAMPLGRLRALLGEGEWMEDLGAESCIRVARGIAVAPAVEVTVELGSDRAACLARAGELFRRFGFAFDPATAAALGDELTAGVRARRGVVEAVRLSGALPGGQALAATCSAAGVDLSPAVNMVERSIAAREVIEVDVEAAAGGASVVVSFVAGSGGGPASTAN
ncbi:MAG TPA: hypothetical protein VFU21_13960 [Kofleriaceae bacterium]|nr:hypothetical protein [Kofleriaceae bacterium]